MMKKKYLILIVISILILVSVTIFFLRSFTYIGIFNNRLLVIKSQSVFDDAGRPSSVDLYSRGVFKSEKLVSINIEGRDPRTYIQDVFSLPFQGEDLFIVISYKNGTNYTFETEGVLYQINIYNKDFKEREDLLVYLDGGYGFTGTSEGEYSQYMYQNKADVVKKLKEIEAKEGL